MDLADDFIATDVELDCEKGLFLGFQVGTGKEFWGNDLFGLGLLFGCCLSHCYVSELQLLFQLFGFLLPHFHPFYGLFKPRNGLTALFRATRPIRLRPFGISPVNIRPKGTLLHFLHQPFLILHLLQLLILIILIDNIQPIDHFLFLLDSHHRDIVQVTVVDLVPHVFNKLSSGLVPIGEGFGRFWLLCWLAVVGQVLLLSRLRV